MYVKVTSFIIFNLQLCVKHISRCCSMIQPVYRIDRSDWIRYHCEMLLANSCIASDLQSMLVGFSYNT